MKPSEVKILKEIARLQKDQNLSFSEALDQVVKDGDAGALYAKSLFEAEQQTLANTLSEEVDQLRRDFSSEKSGSRLRQAEDLLREAAEERCREHGWPASALNLAKAMAEICDEAPDVANNFQLLHAQATPHD